MSTLKKSKHYETLKRLHPWAVRLGFVGDWEEIESCKLTNFCNDATTMTICDWDESGVAGDYVRFLRFKMEIIDLTEIPEKYNKQRDYVFVDGEMYYIGERYWFSDDGKKWHEFEFTGFDRDSLWPWKCAPSLCKHISKTKPAGPTPEQIDSIKTLYPDAVKLERSIEAIWYVLQKDRGLITTVYVPNSELWPDVIKLGDEK